MARLSVQDQFAKLQKQKADIEKLEQALLDKEVKKRLLRIVAVIEKAVEAAHAIAAAAPASSGKRGRPAGRAKGARVSKLAGRKVKPKYRNPADKTQTWTGRGRMPLWVAELDGKGKLNSALIK